MCSLVDHFLCNRGPQTRQSIAYENEHGPSAVFYMREVICTKETKCILMISYRTVFTSTYLLGHYDHFVGKTSMYVSCVKKCFGDCDQLKNDVKVNCIFYQRRLVRMYNELVAQ